MKKILTLLTISSLVFVFANCSSTKPAASTTAKTSENPTVAGLMKKYTPAQMEEGKTVWETKCIKCHKLYQPEDRTVDQWESILPRMIKRARLDDNQGGEVRAYILTHTGKS